MAHKRTNPFSRKRGKNKSLGWSVAKALIIPFVVMLSVLAAYWASDEFWLYTHLLLWNSKTPDEEVDPEYDLIAGLDGQPVHPNIGNSGTIGGGSSGGNYGTSSSLGGVNLALMNQISGSYCGDWLLIARDHANKTYMHSEVQWPNGLDAPIVYVTGTAIKESDLQYVELDGVKVGVPHSNLNIQDYTYGKRLDSSMYDLYTVNSAWFNQYGFNFIDPIYTNDMKDGGYYSVFQMQRSFLAIVPSSGSNGEGGRYPSLMNGYSISEGIVRGKDQGDYGYFPDQVSAVIQSGWSRLAENGTDIGISSMNLSSPLASGVAYAMHNAGQGNFKSWYGIARKNSSNEAGTGFNDSSVAYYPSLSGSNGRQLGAELTSDAINRVMSAGERVLSYIASNPDELTESQYLNRTIFDGMAAAVGIYGCDGFVTSTSKTRLQTKMSNSVYVHGFGIAYRALVSSASQDSDMKGFVSSLDTSKGDTIVGSGYYDLYKGKYETDPTIYLEDPSHAFTASDGTSHRFVHALVEEPTSGLLWVPIGGSYLYWKMLQYAGVDCTFEEVMTDNSGSLIGEIPSYITNVAAVGERIARRAVMMSWPTRDEGLTYWGTALYLCAWNIVRNEHNYARSCDAFACTSIRWGGGDDNINEISASDMYAHCFKSDLWTSIIGDKDTGVVSPSTDALQPGDIVWTKGDGQKPSGFPAKGHIMVYVGKEILHEYYPDAPADYDLCHASFGSNKGSTPVMKQSKDYKSRSGNCASFANCTSKQTWVMRTSGMETSKYVDILTDAEIYYLFQNPKLLGESEHRWDASDTGVPIVDISMIPAS